MARIFAAADIGSNTVHLLVAESDGKSTRRLENESDWLGLGEVVARQDSIPPNLVAHLMRTLARFRQAASNRKAERIYFFATEAMRRAENHNEILKRIRQELGVEVEIISGRREAELALKGALMDCPSNGPAALFDVGGGSAQVARFDVGEISDEASLSIGTGALMADWQASTPSEDEITQTKHKVNEAIEQCKGFAAVVSAISSGGVARGMLRALHPDGDRRIFGFELDFLERTLRVAGPSVAAQRFAIGSRRASCMLPGVWVLQALMNRFDLDEIAVSEYSIRDGAVLAMAAGELEGAKV